MGKLPLNTAQQRAMDEALNIAIGARDLDMMTNAVDAGADANILLFKGVENQQIAWVRAAVEHGADVNASMAGVSFGNIMNSSTKYPVFFWLARNMSSSIGDYLLSKGADIDATSPTGNTALLAAVWMRDKQAIQYLTEHGADPLKLCADQKFPLQELESSNNWSNSSEKVPLIKAMMANLKKKADAVPDAVTTAANDPGSATTAQDIEINRPLELKKPKPKTGFDL